MRLDLVRQELRANNLANASTPGFQRDKEFVVSERPTVDVAGDVRGRIQTAGPVPYLERPVMVGGVVDDSRGAFIDTGNDMDVVIGGVGYVEVGEGPARQFMRTASLTVQDGALVTTDGRPVIGQRGPVRLANDAGVSMVDDGAIVSIGTDASVLVDGEAVDRLRIVQAGLGATWAKRGDGGLVPIGAEPVLVGRPEVVTGSLEQSNVQGVSEMVDMMALYRHYEASQKVVQAIDESLGKAVNDVGRVG